MLSVPRFAPAPSAASLFLPSLQNFNHIAVPPIRIAPADATTFYGPVTRTTTTAAAPVHSFARRNVAFSSLGNGVSTNKTNTNKPPAPKRRRLSQSMVPFAVIPSSKPRQPTPPPQPVVTWSPSFFQSAPLIPTGRTRRLGGGGWNSSPSPPA